jgi:hypothetical protein
MTDLDITATTDDEKSAIASVAVSVAKDLSVAVAGTVIGLGLLTGFSVVANKLAAHKAAKTETVTVAHAA